MVEGKDKKPGLGTRGDIIIRGIIVAAAGLVSLAVLNPAPAIATAAIVYGNYEHNKNKLNQKSDGDKGQNKSKGKNNDGPSPFNKGLWRGAAIAVGTLLGGPVGLGIASILVAVDFLSDGKLTEATNKVSGGNLKGGIMSTIEAVVWDTPKSLLKGVVGVVKTVLSKSTEAQKLSKRDHGEDTKPLLKNAEKIDERVPDKEKDRGRDGPNEGKGGSRETTAQHDGVRRTQSMSNPGLEERASKLGKNLRQESSPSEEKVTGNGRQRRFSESDVGKSTSQLIVGDKTAGLAQERNEQTNQRKGAER